MTSSPPETREDAPGALRFSEAFEAPLEDAKLLDLQGFGDAGGGTRTPRHADYDSRLVWLCTAPMQT